ncbi:MAG: HNH endonuclease [Cyclobacteriaceae bacterium]|nr:HNH endonuclease [Cyclobacteriaceae bacterium]
MYSSDDIVWIKNVKRNKGDGWAYADKKCGTNFLLNWPTKKGGSAKTPKVGDIIVLFQKPNEINGRHNKKVHITHLVSPVSDTIHIDNNSPDHKYCREVLLIAVANPIHSIPNPGYFNFFKPNRGLTNPIANLSNNIELTGIETKEIIWELFQNHFCKNLTNEILNPIESNSFYGEVEGDKGIREHIKQEFTKRSPGIVQRAKETALKKGNGRIKCECCKFDFYEAYGQLGENFIECHHKIHLATGERITKIEDLALVCSNCHRMLHRKQKDGSYHDITSLQTSLNPRFKY